MPLERSSAKIRSAWRQGRALHPADISDYSAVTSARSRHFETTIGPVTSLVNNAGWDRAANFLDTTPEFWTKVVGDQSLWVRSTSVTSC